ncbi:sigma 54-interacting transcriptional regulator [Lewinella sp. W8]|uniref:sigma 54-interacting transcriptional regulator n=1 Tax=Lewinella sp. W8 TaxID=2528208 RepID=UPI0010672711|nr:sigma 54-interacting transcriptional regulator [Lewinella sp. W8]MTB52598.1 PAS domain S-box protein [Lewinella sp. W8]
MSTPSDSDQQNMAQRATFDLVGEGVLWIDQQGKIAEANTAAAQILGYAKKDLTQSSYFEINPHFSLLGWRKYWKQLLELGGERLETEFVNADGKLFNVRGRVNFASSQQVHATCVVVFSSTESVQREADLLELVQDHGDIAGWEWNLITGQVFIAPPLRRWLALSPERDYYPAAEFAEILRGLLSDRELSGANSNLEQVLHSAKTFDRIVEVTLADQPTLSLRVRGKSVENELEVYKVYGSAAPPIDRSPQVGLDDQAEALAFSLDRSQDTVYWVDMEGGNIIYANAHALEATGYNRQELLRSRAVDLVPEEDRERFAELVKELPQTDFLEFTSETLCKDGRKFPSRAVLHFRESGDRKLMVAVVQDLSQLREDHENRELHTTTLNSLQEWVIWLDANNRLVMLNTAARKKLSRKTSLELIGQDIAGLMPDLEIPPLAEIREEQLDGRQRAAVDYVFATASGDQRSLQIRFAQVAAGNQLFLCLLCRDVTAEYNNRRRLQQTKRRVDELRKQLESENEALKEKIETAEATGPIITVSTKYQRILAQVAQVADTDATVLITGETGTGKELLAQSIHQFSNRSSRQMVSVNCAALPDNLIESELFGHERGAFTGAFAQKKGKFEIADGGTIFLDEIGELPLDMQAKILRALQEGEIQRIGATESIKVDVRVVAATNRDLESMINDGSFREDLYYRLNVFPIHNLALRERREDIPVLVKHFTKLYATKMGRPITQISQRDLEKLQEYDFPGNVRELINLVERAVITSNTSTLNLGASLRALRRADRSEGLQLGGDRLVSFEEMQRQYIVEALRRTKGKVTGPGGAAELLQLNGRTLLSKMNKLGIDRNEFTR